MLNKSLVISITLLVSAVTLWAGDIKDADAAYEIQDYVTTLKN